MNESHVQKPFLLTDYVANLVQEIYSHTPPEASDAQDLFRLYMICAISAVPLRRRGLEQQHPYSFFLAASAYFDKVNFSSGVEALQNLFLLARFAVYFHIGAMYEPKSRAFMLTLTRCIDMGTRKNLYRHLYRAGNASASTVRNPAA